MHYFGLVYTSLYPWLNGCCFEERDRKRRYSIEKYIKEMEGISWDLLAEYILELVTGQSVSKNLQSDVIKMRD